MYFCCKPRYVSNPRAVNNHIHTKGQAINTSCSTHLTTSNVHGHPLILYVHTVSKRVARELISEKGNDTPIDIPCRSPLKSHTGSAFRLTTQYITLHHPSTDNTTASTYIDRCNTTLKHRHTGSVDTSMCSIYKKAQVVDKHARRLRFLLPVCKLLHIIVVKQYGGGWFIITSACCYRGRRQKQHKNLFML